MSSRQASRRVHRFAIRCLLAASLLASTLAPIAAEAIDGVTEINQACATQTGCMRGDAPGFPVTVSDVDGRSMRMTSNLVVPDVDTTAIEIVSNAITIDMNGFGILRAGCQGVPVNCRPSSGTGDGIRAAPLTFGTTLRNGSITGMGQYGVTLGAGSNLFGIQVRWSRLMGIKTSGPSSVTDCRSDQNGDRGLDVGHDSRIVNSGAHQNLGIGMTAGTGCVIRDSTSSGNGSHGISTAGGCSIVNSTADSNSGTGIWVNDGSVVQGSTALSNAGDGIRAEEGVTITGNSAYGNSGDGIETDDDCLVQSNSVRANFGVGMRLGTLGVGYRENVINQNGAGTVVNGVNLFGNVCNFTTTCP